MHPSTTLSLRVEGDHASTFIYLTMCHQFVEVSFT